MKKLLSILTLASVVTLATSMWSCQPKNNNSDTMADVAKLDAGDAAFPATSLGFKLNVANIESYVYKIEEGENKPAPDPVVLFAEAKEITKINDGEHSIFIYGTEGNKTYTVHFVFKIAGQNKYISKSLSSATAAYTRLINVISADRFEIKVQFNVAETQYFKYVIKPRAEYYDQISQGAQDIALLKYGILKKGPQVITYADGQTTGYNDPDTGEFMPALVKPGMPFVVLFAECDKDGNIDYELSAQGGGAPQLASANRPAETGYTETCTDIDYSFTNRYAKTYVASAKPIQGEGKFDIQQTMTERTATFKITPPASIINYGLIIMPKTEYDSQKAIVGEDGIMGFMLSQLKPFTGVQTITNADPMVKGEIYYLIIIGNCDQNGETQISTMVEHTPIVSDKPAVQLVVTPIENLQKPYEITFNIKAPNKDCYGARYMLEYSKIWMPLLNDKGNNWTYETLVTSFGTTLSSLQVDQINSAAGLDLPFDSWEDTESILAVNSFNKDEKVDTFQAKIRSGKEPAQPRVESDLFTSLLGDWDVTFDYAYPESENDVKTAHFRSNIASGPASADPNFGPGHESYNYMLSYYIKLAESNGVPEDQRLATAKQNIIDDVQKYKETSARFTTKYREQNRIVMTSFLFNTDSYGLDYTSAWDLFCSPYYSAYDVDQLFFDYGPKIFFGISKDAQGKDVVTLETDYKVIAPFSAFDGNVTRRVVGFKDNKICYNPFPVEIVDQNTIKISEITTYEGVEYPFTLFDNNIAPNAMAKSDIVLTRATGPAKVAPYRVFTVSPTGNINGGNKRTTLPAMVKSIKRQKPIAIPIYHPSAK